MKKLSISVVPLCFLFMVGFSAQVGAYDEISLKKLNVLGNCSSCDLSGANLEGANLTGAKLFESDLAGADLTGANLEGAKLCHTQTDWGEDNSGC